MVIALWPQDLVASKAVQAQLDVQCQSMKMEKVLLKQTEEHLRQENESLLKAQRSHEMVMANLKMIQVIKI